jgi:hypothetical protein
MALFHLLFPDLITPQYIHGLLTAFSGDVVVLTLLTVRTQTVQCLHVSCSVTYCHIMFRPRRRHFSETQARGNTNALNTFNVDKRYGEAPLSEKSA